MFVVLACKRFLLKIYHKTKVGHRNDSGSMLLSDSPTRHPFNDLIRQQTRACLSWRDRFAFKHIDDSYSLRVEREGAWCLVEPCWHMSVIVETYLTDRMWITYLVMSDGALAWEHGDELIRDWIRPHGLWWRVWLLHTVQVMHSREGFHSVRYSKTSSPTFVSSPKLFLFIYLRIFAGGLRSEISHLREQYLQDLELDQIDSRK